MKVRAYSAKGVKQADFTLPKGVVEQGSKDLVAQAVHVSRDRGHLGLSRTKTRGEVSRTTAKIYAQKHTGRARHGARGAPLFVGGGKAHGPTGVKRELVMPKNMRKKALSAALALAVKNGKLVVVSGVERLKKTKEAKVLVDKVSVKGKITVCLSDKNWKTARVFRNLKNVDVERFGSLNAYKVVHGGELIVDKEVFSKNA